MKFGHMDGMHCIIDGTSVLVKIKSVALYNCRTVYINPTHDMHQWLLLQFLVLLIVDAESVRNILQ
jgi:hypothetical protein